MFTDRLLDHKRFKAAGLICLDGQFFPSVHYPPITMYPSITEDELFSGYANPSSGTFSIYVHIPFCIRFCNFCHYPNRIGATSQEKDRYLSALDREMDIYMNRLGIRSIKARSVLIGGGTPTFLSPEQLKRFLGYFTKKVDLSACPQFNYDVDPSTLLGPEGDERLKILKDFGVTRLTIGIQSLNDNILVNMNRAHTAAEAIESVRQAKKHGFKLCVEFIYGYSGETIDTWTETLKKAIALDVEEIQLYHIKFIPYGDHKGLITKKFIERKEVFPTPEDVIVMKETGARILNESGYNENLTRVFTKKPEFYSRYAHEQCCDLLDQIGFGISGFSSLRDRFGLNTQSMNEYYSMVEGGKLPVNRGLVRTQDDQIRWHIILPLKNRKVYKAMFQKRTGVSLGSIFRKKIERLKEFGLVSEDEKVLELTPLGRFFADEICMQFHDPKYMPFPREAYSEGPLNPYNDTQL
jgi:oxygen-independent coproporphyrinogen-3 oxidase